MLYPLQHFLTNTLQVIFWTPCNPRRTIGKTWTIGQKTSTHGQDGSRLGEAKFVIRRDVIDQRHP